MSQAGVMQSKVSKALVIPLLNRLKAGFAPMDVFLLLATIVESLSQYQTIKPLTWLLRTFAYLGHTAPSHRKVKKVGVKKAVVHWLST